MIRRPRLSVTEQHRALVVGRCKLLPGLEDYGTCELIMRGAAAARCNFPLLSSTSYISLCDVVKQDCGCLIPI